MKTDITETRDGLRIHVAHDDSDSLAVIEVTHRYNVLVVRAGARGNFDADKRPMRWMSTSLEAPLVKASERLDRLFAYVKRNQHRMRPSDYESLDRIAGRLRVEDA